MTASLSAEERVVELLRTYNEARVSYGTGSTGQGVTMMPSMWHEGSYSELERRLIEMRESNYHSLWWHVCHRYRFGTEQTLVLPVVRTRGGAVFSLPARTELVAGGPAVGSKHALARVYYWPQQVDERKVQTGVNVLARRMQGRIELPMMVLYRRLGMALPPRLLAA